MDRNAPCPCGSGRKFKKCHGAAVPPEVSTLSTEARADWVRADAVTQRQKRVAQQLLDWAERKLGAAWLATPLRAWGIIEETDINEAVTDLFTAWSLFNFRPAALEKSIAGAWLDDAAARRTDEDTRLLVSTAIDAPLGIWEVVSADAGVGMTLTDRLRDSTVFVHESELTHDLGPGEFLLAYVVAADSVHVLSAVHADSLLPSDGQALVSSVLADAGQHVAPLPIAHQTDPTWQIQLARRWTDIAVAEYAGPDQSDDAPSL